MPFDNRNHHRRSIRLPGRDYAQPGFYFVTLCTYERQCLFDDPRVRRIAEHHWESLPYSFDTVSLDTWIVMPNHLHGIVLLRSSPSPAQEFNEPGAVGKNEPAAENTATLKPRPLGTIIRTYKRSVTGHVHRERMFEGSGIWQRGYWERIVRDDAELTAIRRYIVNNPIRWAEKRDNLDELRERMIYTQER